MQRVLSKDSGEIFAISPDGQTLATSALSESGRLDSDKSIKIWNLRTGKLLRTLSSHSGMFGLGIVAISPDGQTLVISSISDREPVTIWRLW